MRIRRCSSCSAHSFSTVCPISSLPLFDVCVCVQLFHERKVTYTGAGAIAAGEIIAAGCVLFFTLGWVIYCVESEHNRQATGGASSWAAVLALRSIAPRCAVRSLVSSHVRVCVCACLLCAAGMRCWT